MADIVEAVGDLRAHGGIAAEGQELALRAEAEHAAAGMSGEPAGKGPRVLVGEDVPSPEGVAPVYAHLELVQAQLAEAAIVIPRIDPDRATVGRLQDEVGLTRRLAGLEDCVDAQERVLVQPVQFLLDTGEVKIFAGLQGQRAADHGLGEIPGASDRDLAQPIARDNHLDHAGGDVLRRRRDVQEGLAPVNVPAPRRLADLVQVREAEGPADIGCDEGPEFPVLEFLKTARVHPGDAGGVGREPVPLQLERAIHEDDAPEDGQEDRI